MTAPRCDQGRTVRPRAQGVLRAPAFGHRHPRLSATFVGSPGSWIEQDLLDRPFLSDAEERRVGSAVATMMKARVGGEFWGPRLAKPTPDRLLLLRPRSFSMARAMVRDAVAETEAALVMAAMPDRPWARRFGATLERRGVHVHLGALDPWSVLEQASRVKVDGEDPIALLALALGKAVQCETACSFAGWGLTEDAAGLPNRGSRSFIQLAHAALISGVNYRNPFNGRQADCEDIVDILAHWRRAFDRNQAISACVGISIWKREAVAAMLRSGDRAPTFHRRAHPAVEMAAREGGAVAAWTSRAPAGLTATAAWRETPVLQVEDGFLRSTGLGSNLTPPCSIVVDGRAPHYAAGQVSDLETLLADSQFDPALLSRADRLIKAITAHGLTKYNTGGAPFERPSSRRLVLVPGQVEDDLSIVMGGAGVSGNLELLQRVRAAEPSAIILFKPHPDVEAGHRRGAVSDRQAQLHADQVIRNFNTAQLLEVVDAVHVLTSLTGFEALLRNREVVVHGQPFYSGWGLTRDLAPIARRTRKLTLTELVAAALILYPNYLDPRSGLPCPPEVLVGRLASPDARRSVLGLVRQAQGRLRRTASAWRREVPA